MNILDKIIAQKHIEVAANTVQLPSRFLEQLPNFQRETLSLKTALLDATKQGIIAEHKRKSPSKGIINDKLLVQDVTQGYVAAGASVLSVLTDTPFFGGSLQDLTIARAYNHVPILRKDFIIDEYQLLEAKAYGADVILLIGECLTKKEVEQLANFAKSLSLSVLYEVHSEDQLDKLCPAIDAVGVNNRNLKTFEVSLQTSIELATKIPNDFVKVSESGISNPQSINELRQFGYKGFLIGENFMKTSDAGLACKEFIERTIIGV
jgi:indole-3-glycerol phosphate synthase